MNIFQTLLKLYNSNLIRTPLEDFTTEILVFVLNQIPEIGDSFVNNVLHIPGKGFKITSQEVFSFKRYERKHIIVDVVIRNEDTICFLENKVNSEEGYNQLFYYSEAIRELNYPIKQLRYCTKFYEDKFSNFENFYQFRWCNIANFLTKWNENEIIIQFLEFLETNKMGNSTDFTMQELLSMQNINSALLKMNSYLDKIKPTFAFKFGETGSPSPHKQLIERSRQIIVKHSILGNGSEVGAGFDFGVAPKILVWIWVSRSCENYQSFGALNVPQNVFHNHEYLEYGCPLSDFISSETMELDIENWFFSSFEILETIIKQNTEVTWYTPDKTL